MNEAAVFVLRLHVTVHEFDQQFLFQAFPNLELVLGRVHTVVGDILNDFGEGSTGNHDVSFGGKLLLELHHNLVVHYHGHAVYGMRAALGLVPLEGVDLGAHMRCHDIVHLVAGIGDAVVDPERRRSRVVEHVSVPLLEALGHLGSTGVDGSEIGRGRIVGSEPENTAHDVGNIVACLAHHPEARLLGGDGTLVHIGLAVKLEFHGAPAVRKGVATRADVLGHIHGRTLVVVSHDIGNFLDTGLLAGIHEQWQVSVKVVAQHVVQVVVGIAGDGVAVLVVEGEPAVGEDVISGPDTGIAATDRAKIHGAVGFFEAELTVQTVEIALAAGEGNDVGSIETVVGVIEGELADACLIGVGADGTVGDAHGHPHDALLGIHPVLDVHALADEFHDPGLVLVRDGESFSFGGIAVGVGQVYNDINGFAGRLGALQGNVDERAVINSASLVLKFRTAAPGGFRNDELELVHVTYGLVGMGNLLDFTQITVGIPLVNGKHTACLPVAGRLVIQLTEESVRVGSIGNQHRAVPRGAAGDNYVGAGKALGLKCNGRQGYRHQFEYGFCHGYLGFFD